MKKISWYNIKWGFWALKHFFKVVKNDVRPWDYNGSLVFLKKHLETILNAFETNQREVDETRIPKENDIKRCIELIDNVLEDEYWERCGYDFKRNKYNFVPCKDKPGHSQLVWEIEGAQTKEEIDDIKTRADKLEKDEWDELWDTIKNGNQSNCGMKGWWD